MSHHLPAWIRVKNKEMEAQRHSAFKPPSAFLSQEQIKELGVYRGKTNETLEMQLKFLK